MFLLLLACSDYTIHPYQETVDPLLYQTAVLDFMCSATCTWEDEPSCWSDLETHWGFCLEGDEVLDVGLAEDCLALMDKAGDTGECTWLPDECMVSEVALSGRDEGEACRSR